MGEAEEWFKDDMAELDEYDLRVLRSVSQVGRLPDITAANIEEIESAVIWLTECGMLMRIKNRYALTRYGTRLLMVKDGGGE